MERQPAIYTEVVGNIFMPDWSETLRGADIERVELDQWTAQKSRFVARGDRGGDYAVALKRNTRVLNGDILAYDADRNRAVVVYVRLNDVLVIDLRGLYAWPHEEQLQRAVELGHALGNQHWPAVVRDEKVYVPLTVDRKVMSSVMDTHHIEGITYRFQPGEEVIPYLAPHEIRRLFGGTEHPAHQHDACGGEAGHTHVHVHG